MKPLKTKFRNAILSAFFLSIGYFAVVFLVIMYLQGIRGLSPLDASLLLVPGYVAGSFLGPNNGEAQRQIRLKRLSYHWRFLLGSGNISLPNHEYYLAALDCPYRLSNLGLRHIDVLPSRRIRAVMANARQGSLAVSRDC